MPAMRWNAALNEPRLWKPTSTQISVTLRSVLRRSSCARSTRRLSTYWCLAEGLLEAPAEVPRRAVRAAGERLHVERLGVGAVDEVLGAAQVGDLAGGHRFVRS
jgi:hypothetical protein